MVKLWAAARRGRGLLNEQPSTAQNTSDVTKTFTSKQGHTTENPLAVSAYKSLSPAAVRLASRGPSCCEAANPVVREGNELRGPECQRGGPGASREGGKAARMSFWLGVPWSIIYTLLRWVEVNELASLAPPVA